MGYLVSSFFHAADKTETRFVHDSGNYIGLERSVDMDLFWDVWKMVNEEHIYEEEVADKVDRVEGAIQGMLNSLDDPYTVFMNAEDHETFNESLGGELEGIGAEVTMKNGFVTIVTPLKGSPAEEAGILPGDIIAEVDGESTETMMLGEAVSKIKGPRGTKVLLGIARRGESGIIDVEIVRQKIHYDSVKWEMKEGGIAYIEIIQFDDNTYRKFNSAINDILLEEPEGLIIDVRSNSGGYLNVSVDLLSEFTADKRKAVIIRSKDSAKNQVIYTSGRARLDDVPVVVLVNGGSASASEIVAGAIQDWERGTLIGEQTFGKGSVQEIRPLDDGAAIRITVAKWNTPNDNNIDKEGILPDIEIERTPEDRDNDRDPQLDCAIEFLETGECTQAEKVAFWENES